MLDFEKMRNEYLYDLYRIAFLSVKQKSTNGVTNAAKPALVIAVIEGIAAGEIKNNQIKFPDIEARYVSKLEEWQPEKTPLKYPFYHLERDGFWHLKWKIAPPAKGISPSAKFLRDNIDYAYFDNALWDLLQEEEVRKGYIEAITKYFKNA